jgi:uncharacterized protein
MSQQVPPQPPGPGGPGAGPPPPPPQVPPPGGVGGQAPLTPDQERLWAMLAHLLAFVAAYIALGFVGPLVVLLIFGPRSAFVRTNAVEALNFNLSWLLYAVVGVILALLLIGILILIVLGIAYVILVIIAAVQANNGQVYRYPATIRFIR